MNHFLTVWTIFILAAALTSSESLKQSSNILSVESAANNCSLEKMANPQIYSAIPQSIVDEKYIAKVSTNKSSITSYFPYFIGRKIKFNKFDTQTNSLACSLNENAE